MWPTRQDAIDELFQAFDEAPRPTAIDQLDICPCCVSEDDCRALLQSDRRSITGDVLGEYVHTARSAVTKSDYLYFFPRIAEVIFIDDAPYEWEPIFERLGAVEAQHWTERQRSGLASFMSAVIAEILSDTRLRWRLQEVMCCVARSGIDITPHLDQLIGHPAALVEFLRANPSAEISGRLSYGFQGTDSDEAHAAILAWVHSDPVLELLTARAEEAVSTHDHS